MTYVWGWVSWRIILGGAAVLGSGMYDTPCGAA